MAEGAGEGRRREARGWLVSLGAFLAALLANSHHTLHMLLLSLGVGVGFSSLLFNPAARRVMLAASLAMTAATLLWLLRRPHRSAAQKLGVAASIAASLGLVAYTVVKHGW